MSRRFIIKIDAARRNGEVIDPKADLPTSLTITGPYYGGEADELNRDLIRAICDGINRGGWQAWVEEEITTTRRLP